MSKNLLKINISNFKHVGGEEDLIEIKINDDDFVQVSFSKLVSYSKYIRDKYKYSEAAISIENDLKKFAQENEIKEESIKHFIELIKEENVTIINEQYCDIYRLSEYFDIPIFIFALDKLREENLYKDIDFTIQFLSETLNKIPEEETKLNKKVEEFLTTHINECLLNDKFSTLPISTIYRLLEKSSKETLNNQFLIEFILKSIDAHFIFLKFVQLHKLSESEVDSFFKMIREQIKNQDERYFEYIPFDLIFFEHLKTRYDLLFEEMNRTKDNLNRTKEELNKMKTDFEQTKVKHNQTEMELKQTKSEMNQTKDNLNRTKEELNKMKTDFEQTKIKLDHTKEELNQTKVKHNQTEMELKQTKSEMNQTLKQFQQTKEELEQTNMKLKESTDEIEQLKRKINKFSQSIVVAGINRSNQLGEKSNNVNENGSSIISPPLILPFEHFSFLSYSIFNSHSVLIRNDGSIQGIGYNIDGSISSSLVKTKISQFTDFSIKDNNGHILTPISAVCSYYGTLYMFSKNNGIGNQLVYCDCAINGGNPVFLNIGNHEPVAIFSGNSHAAAISCKGEIIFINRDTVKKSPNSPISAVSLPNSEKAMSVSCCNNLIVVLSSNGRVFSSSIASGSNILKFSIVKELAGEEIVCISGVDYHVLAVSKKGHAFGYGSNKFGQLGLGKEIQSVSSFIKISSLNGYEIRAAYAGHAHSLFETPQGQILSCGSNSCGQLLLSSGIYESVYSPTETVIRGGSTFCIAGRSISIVFIGNDPPINTPNRRIQQQ